MAERQLIVKIIGDSRSLERSFTRSSRSSQNFEHNMARASRGAISAAVSFRGLGRALAFGSLQFLGGAGIVFAIKSTIAAAEQSQKVLAQTANAVQRSGLSWQKYGKQIQEAALAQSNLSGFDDERLLGTFSNLVRRTGDVTQALKLNALAADVARGKGIELEAAQQIVFKASIGQAGALRRANIQVGKSATAYQLLNVLQRKFAGSAAAYGRTAAGAQDRFRVAIQNTQEAIGTALLPTITTYLNKGADWLNQTDNQQLLQSKLTTAVQNTALAIDKIGTAAGTAIQAVQTLSTVLGGIESATPSWLKDFFTKNAPPGTAIDVLTGSHGVERLLKLLNPGSKESGSMAKIEARLAELRARPKQNAVEIKALTDLLRKMDRVANGTAPDKPLSLTGPLGKLQGIVTPARKGITTKQQNTFFDNAISRILTRGGLRDLQGQLAAIQKASALISARLKVTKDITRKLNLEDQLLQLGSQASDIRAQIAQAARDRLQAQKDRIAQAAATRLAQRTARQFRELGLNALGEEPTPGVAGLRKRLQQLAGNIAGTNLDTPKLRTQLARFRKVLSEGLVPKDVRAKIAQMMDDIAQQLKDSGTRNETKFRHVNSNLILAGLGLTPEQIRSLRGRIATIGAGGTVPGSRSLAFSGAGAAPIVVEANTYLDGKLITSTVTKGQQKAAKRRAVPRRGTYAGRH